MMSYICITLPDGFRYYFNKDAFQDPEFREQVRKLVEQQPDRSGYELDPIENQDK